MENAIKRLQCNLLLLRRAAGWSADTLGKKIGVTRQTINNIELGRSDLTQPLYMAIRLVMDQEITEHPDETEMLKGLLDMLVDNPEKYDPDKTEDLKQEAELITPSMNANKTRKEVSQNWVKKAKNMGIIVAAISVVTTAIAWLANLSKK